MKARDLPVAPQPRPRELQVCVACRAFKAEALVPTNSGGALAMCWICAHHVVEHDTAVEAADTARCECVPQEIYPRSFWGPRAEDFERARDAFIERCTHASD